MSYLTKGGPCGARGRQGGWGDSRGDSREVKEREDWRSGERGRSRGGKSKEEWLRLNSTGSTEGGHSVGGKFSQL